jgi:hypothetical protein
VKRSRSRDPVLHPMVFMPNDCHITPGSRKCPGMAAWLAVAVAWISLIGTASATTIVSLNPELNPSGPSPATFTFGQVPAAPPGTLQFAAGPGSLSNGDGNLPPTNQHSPGLELKTPLNIIDPATLYGRQNNADGSTTFYDTSLVFQPNDLQASSAVQTFSPAPGVQFDFQSLTSATFSIYGSLAGGYTPGTPGPLLLRGTITTATLNGLDGANIGTALSSTVTYTSGAIYDKLVALGGTPSGSVTINLSLINNLPGQSPVFGIGPPPGYLLPFSATGQAIFDSPRVITPEPAGVTLCALGLLGWLFVARASKRSKSRRI